MRKYLIISAILLVAAVLRFYRLSDYPALNADEAAIGYNAYSLIQTGKDEHGNLWPIHFQSFNDYKPGLYFYTVIPFVKFLGLNELAVRIPGAIFGVLTVYLVYLLAKELFLDWELEIGRWKLGIGELGAFLLAISPWHLHFSRGGWEVNAATFFITFGILLFLKGIKRPKYLFLSSFAFVLSLYTYHAARIIVPLILLGITLIHFKEVKAILKLFMITGLVAFALLLPLIRDLVGPAGIARAGGVGLFADIGPINRVNEQRGEHDDITSLSAKLLHNKTVNYGLAFLSNWAKHYHGEFLFLSGDDIQRNKVPETGQMYLFEILTVLIGMIVMFREIKNKGVQLIILWVIVAPIASALTFQSPHALRAHNMVIPLTIISATGLYEIVRWLSRNNANKLVNSFCLLLVATVIALNFARYIHMYYIHMAKEYPFSSQYGVKELAEYLNSGISDKYKKVVVTDRYDQPYIQFLFYLKYDPGRFQKEHTLSPKDQYGFSTVRSFDKYVFISIHDWDSLRTEYRDSLVAGTDEEIFEGTNVIKNIYGPNGYKYFQVVAN